MRSSPVSLSSMTPVGGFWVGWLFPYTSPPHHRQGSPVIRAMKVDVFVPTCGEEKA